MTTKITSASTRETVGVHNDERTVLVTLGPDDSITLRPKGLYTGFKVSVAALLAFAEKQADRKPGVTTYKLARTVKSKADAVPPPPAELTQP